MKSDVERGMELTARLPDIMPQDADERVKRVYDDIQTCLRVPIVNKIFRTLANYPNYFEQSWNLLRPIVVTREFEKRADELRRLALLSVAAKKPTLSLGGYDDADRLLAFNATIHYVLPKLLLITTLLDEGATNEAGSLSTVSGHAAIPLGIADGTAKVKLLDSGAVSDPVKSVFEQVKQTHQHSGVSSYFRGLANWPEFLERVWGELQPYVGSDEYVERRADLLEFACDAVDPWGAPGIPIPENVHKDVPLVLAAFRLKYIPDMLLDSVLIMSFLGGAEAATSSRFSAANFR
jgi:hypothetical protein